MVVILNEIGETNGQTIRDAYEQAFNELKIPHRFRTSFGKGFHDVTKRVSEIMQDKVKGRLTPVHKNRGSSPSAEAHRSANRTSDFKGSYPKYIKTDKDKLKHLDKLYDSRQIDYDMYLEFSQLLDVKEDQIKLSREVELEYALMF